ncbi:GMC family oxidoreductase [Acidobacteria bacterium AH-259-D05]|nr:GMC family oxidoreductase [Acidobacteria bacterium AH-259-D05]
MEEKVYDICIIGCGAAGGVLAYELAKGGLSVVAFDGGPRFDPFKDFRNDELYARNLFLRQQVVLAGENPMRLFMVKAIGGGTVHYSAVSLRFHRSDFRMKSDDGVGEDWPITYEELEPYYDRVERMLGVSGSNINPFDESRGPYPLPPHQLNANSHIIANGAAKLGLHTVPSPLAIISRNYDGRFACNQCGFCFEGCRMTSKSSVDLVYVPRAEKYGALIRPNCQVRCLEVDAQGKVQGVIYFDEYGREMRQKASVFVVSCNAVNTPRLLLNSTSKLFPQGLGNHNGIIGRYFMHNTVAAVFGEFDQKLDSFKGLPQGAMIQDFYRSDPQRGFVRGYTMETFYVGPIALANGFMAHLWGKELSDFMAKYPYYAALWLGGEDLPNKNNRVTLDPDQKDEYGMPLPRVNYSYGENDLKLREHSMQMAEAIFDAAGAVKTFRSPARGSAHLMGTCRMGDDPERFVVNRNCQSHSVRNLFLCDGSVFVTSTAANPTLSIQALATRTADYILAEKNHLL